MRGNRGCGKTGKHMQDASGSSRSSKACPHINAVPSLAPLLQGSGKVTLVGERRLVIHQSMKPSALSARPASWWVLLIQPSSQVIPPARPGK